MFVLGLSGKKHSGKSTVAKHLVEKHGFYEMSWADPLKMHIGMSIMGFTFDQVYGERKEVVDEYWGDTPRAFLQKIGTDLFRDQLDTDFWVKAGKRHIAKLQEGGHNKIVVSDCRFPNEVEAITQMGGRSIRVTRENYHVPDFHASETALDGFKFDGVISAESGNVEMLLVRAEQMLEWFRIKYDAAV